MVFHAKRNNKKPRVTILASGETDFKTKAITKHKGYYSMIRGLIQDKDIICINMHTPRVPKYMKQTFTDMKGETDNNTITKGDFRTSLVPLWLSGKESACECRRHEFDPVFLPGKRHGQRSLADYSPWGYKRVRHTLVTRQHLT